jgi:hypothetical protein
MPRTTYQQFVSDFAAANRGIKWGKGGLMKAAGAAWRTEGHVVATKKPKSACSGVKRPACLPPCVWTQGPKRQYCHAKAVRAVKATGAHKLTPVKRAPIGPRPKLAPGLHSCAGLGADPCEVAPNCYWQPTKSICKTRSGKQVKQRMQGAERKAMLSQLRGQQGGYY